MGIALPATNSGSPALHSLVPSLQNVAAISQVETPFWITLSHELIHLKHKLEEINGDGIVRIEQGVDIARLPYSMAKCIGIEDVLLGIREGYADLYNQLPELSEPRINLLAPWTNLEERRTVIGPDVEGISEASIRKAAGMPTRYMYQDKEIMSLEPNETIRNSVLDDRAISYMELFYTIDLESYCIRDGIPSEMTPIPLSLFFWSMG